MAKTLMVLGNGFDLACGLKSGFRDFLDSDYYSSTLDEMKGYIKRIKNAPFYVRDIPFSEKICFWDLYYGLPHLFKLRNINEWYDFENRLLGFIDSTFSDKSDEFKNIIRCGEEYNANLNYYFGKTDIEIKDVMLYKYLEYRKCLNDTSFLNVLIDDLKKYEKRFGEYIHIEQSSNNKYKNNAVSLVNKLLRNEDEVSYINTFNYTDLSFLTDNIWHINGDNENPIFGIDYSSVNPYLPEFSFTKSYRRLELHDKDIYYPKLKQYSKVVVFGHSLNRQDYSYFFPLFNALNLDNNRNANRKGYYIEFAYCKYGDKEEEYYRKEMVDRVVKLFYSYSKEILKVDNSRLIDILFSCSAIRFRCVDVNL